MNPYTIADELKEYSQVLARGAESLLHPDRYTAALLAHQADLLANVAKRMKEIATQAQGSGAIQ